MLARCQFNVIISLLSFRASSEGREGVKCLDWDLTIWVKSRQGRWDLGKIWAGKWDL